MRVYSDYDFKYNQDINQLHKFPELLEQDIWIEKGDIWNSFRFCKPPCCVDESIDWKKVASVLYSAFSDCLKIAIVWNGDRLEVTSSPKYNNESFEIYRNRTLFELRDYLHIKHSGLGKDSIRLKSKYSHEKHI